MANDNGCLVLLSGGHNSTVDLFKATQTHKEVHALTVYYGQRHQLEVEAARKVAILAKAKTHRVINLGPILIGNSPSINLSIPIPTYPKFSNPFRAGVLSIPGCFELLLALAQNHAISIEGEEDILVHPISGENPIDIAKTIPGCLEALSVSHSCLENKFPPLPFNEGSLRRAYVFSLAGIDDPLIIRAKQLGRLPKDYPGNGLVEGTPYGMKEETEAPKV